MARAEGMPDFHYPDNINWDEYNEFLKQNFQRENKDFVTFLIQDLDLAYQSRILHIGSGAGWLSLELARRMPEVAIVGVEPSHALIKMAARNLSRQNSTNVEYVSADLDHLKMFSDRSFDAIISSNHLHLWKSPEKIFNEMNRVLVKNGKYAIGDYRRDLKIMARIAIGFRSLTMPGTFRTVWRRSIASSYSLKEIVQLLLKTKLKEWKIRTSLFDFLIYRV